MGLRKFDTRVDNIQQLDNNPNISGMTANELKVRFDQAGMDIKEYLNNTLTSEIDTTVTNINDSISNSNEKIGDLDNLTTTNKSNIVSAANEINSKLDDTGWINLPLASGITTGIAGEATSIPQYRKIGKTVFIKGFYKFTKAADSKVLATLPVGFRPISTLYITSSTTGPRVGRTYVTENGEIGCDWVYNLNNDSAYTGNVAWYDVTASFPVI